MLFNTFRKSQTLSQQLSRNLDFKNLLDNLTTAVMLVDEQLRVIHLNTACEHFFGVSLDHVYGQIIDTFFFESSEAFDKVHAAIRENAQYTKRKAVWMLNSGKEMTVDYTVTPMAETKQLLFEIQPLDRLLQISRDEAMIASQETTRNLVRGLAHEVKNPLGGIRGAAQLLDREFDDSTANDELKEYTHIIISEADRLRNLVDRMLGPRDMTPFEEVNVHEVFERVLSIIKAETKGSIDIRRDYDPSIPEFKGDIELLIQAFLNVARNAVQALKSHTDNTAPCIVFSTCIQRQFTIGRNHYPLVCRARITDNGPGIPEKIIKDIFYPMISGRAEGTGLGLAISQQLINQHNGLIECSSEPGKTEFSIYIPLEQNTHDS